MNKGHTLREQRQTLLNKLVCFKLYFWESRGGFDVMCLAEAARDAESLLLSHFIMHLGTYSTQYVLVQCLSLIFNPLYKLLSVYA